MRIYKYKPNEWKYREWDKQGWFRAWNHWANPFGNYHEPMPYPEKRVEQAPKSFLLAWLWWQFVRNPLHNFTHFIIGIVPLGDRYEWITPDEDGWDRQNDCWKKGVVKLCQLKFGKGNWEGYIGWKQRGSFGIALRKKDDS